MLGRREGEGGAVRRSTAVGQVDRRADSRTDAARAVESRWRTRQRAHLLTSSSPSVFIQPLRDPSPANFILRLICFIYHPPLDDRNSPLLPPSLLPSAPPCTQITLVLLDIHPISLPAGHEFWTAASDTASSLASIASSLEPIAATSADVSFPSALSAVCRPLWSRSGPLVRRQFRI